MSFTVLIRSQVFDYFLTLSSEVNLIWPSKMSVTKVLYFCTRYSAFSDAVIGLYCMSLLCHYAVHFNDALSDSLKANISVAECRQMDSINSCESQMVPLSATLLAQL